MADANEPSTAANRSSARRRFIRDSGGLVASMFVLGFGLTLHARSARSVPPDVMRPPGAIAEEEFLGACLRCGLCVRDCPYDTLSLAVLGDGIGVGTPYFRARDIPCEMCDDIPCVAACPSNALSKELTDINNARMGLAVLIDQENCLNYRGLRCDVCYRVCPAIDKAITLEPEHNLRTGKHARFLPIVHSDACTGCGKCEKSCVLDKAAIRVLPINLAKGSPDQHYRMGWEEKQKHGAPLLPDIIDLPDRVPGPVQ